MQGLRKTLRSELLKEAVLKKRRQFFNRIDNEDIRRAKYGVTVTHNPSLPVYTLAARANLANIFSQVDPDGTTAAQRDRRMEALQNFISLCHIREPHHMNPASRAIKGAIEASADDTTCTTKDAKVDDGLLHLRHSFETIELIPLALPSTICLFCLGDAGLIFQARTASFSRIDSLRRPVDEQHLAQHVEGMPLLCPHPSCDEQTPNVGDSRIMQPLCTTCGSRSDVGFLSHKKVKVANGVPINQEKIDDPFAQEISSVLDTEKTVKS